MYDGPGVVAVTWKHSDNKLPIVEAAPLLVLADDDAVISKAFRAFKKQPGEIDMDTFCNMLMAFGDKFTNAEVDDAYAAFDEFVDEDTLQLDSNGTIGMLCAGGD